MSEQNLPSQTLRAIIRAAENIGPDGDRGTMRDAIQVRTAQLSRAELGSLVSGLAWFATAAIDFVDHEVGADANTLTEWPGGDR